MNIDNIKELSKIPLVMIGSHAMNHTITVKCNDNELEFKIAKSKKKLEQWISREVKYFCYPDGQYNGKEKAILKKYDYVLAASTEKKVHYYWR